MNKQEQYDKKIVVGSKPRFAICLDPKSCNCDYIIYKEQTGVWIRFRRALPNEVQAGLYRLEQYAIDLGISCQA